MERIYVMILILFMVAAGCGKKDDVISKEQYMEYMHELGFFEDGHWKNQHVADSMSNVMIRYLKVNDSRFGLSIDRDDIINMGYPSKIYDILLYGVHDLNNTMEMYSRSKQAEIVETVKRQQEELQ